VGQGLIEREGLICRIDSEARDIDRVPAVHQENLRYSVAVDVAKPSRGHLINGRRPDATLRQTGGPWLSPDRPRCAVVRVLCGFGPVGSTAPCVALSASWTEGRLRLTTCGKSPAVADPRHSSGIGSPCRLGITGGPILLRSTLGP